MIQNFFNTDEIEPQALNILNSISKWKSDFKHAKHTIDFDFINSEDVKIEVKSTIKEKNYNQNHFHFHSPNQIYQIIMKLLVNSQNKILKFAFVRKIDGRWKEI